ncbi:MAG: hypothetical protein AAGA62_05735 [Bacteroidota bacterium]
MQQTGKEGHWRVDIGSLQGMREPGTPISILADDKVLTTALVDDIRSAYATLRDATRTGLPTLADALDPTTFYEGRPEAALIPPLQLFIAAEENAPAERLTTLRQLINDLPEVVLAPTLSAAQYCLRVDENQSWLSKPGNRHLLIRPVPVNADYLKTRWREYLAYVAQWQRILALENPVPDRFTSFPVEVYLAEVDTAGREHPLPKGSDHHRLAYRRGINNAPEIELVVRLTNHLERPLYVSLLTMGVDFYCGTDLLGPPVVLLENQSVAIYPESGQPGHLKISPADYLLSDGWLQDTIWFKVIVSTHAAPLETAVTDYALAGLPHPRSMGASIIQSDNRRRKARYGWATRTIQIDLAL